MCRSGPVSRVLSFKTAIYLGRASPRVSSRLPACTERLNRIACLFALASDGVYLSHAVTDVLVRSYRTFSAFLLTQSASGSLSFFSTNPSGFPARPLAGILPQEARTFLMRDVPSRDRPARVAETLYHDCGRKADSMRANVRSPCCVGGVSFDVLV